ncbi:hypothetical protein OB69_05740 [Roseivirga seohaensis subsp. aquiponti]|uniref:Uncharacterized protein n=1 Tax=Roseivirga seohaensis subsp. aquiponti TaxID=1566026 RepID=A0A0L8AMF4_9BACT|nr:hypothetical protein OB69_05740 [Roseivirga seohaensis subsp. aquiponti]
MSHLKNQSFERVTGFFAIKLLSFSSKIFLIKSDELLDWFYRGYFLMPHLLNTGIEFFISSIFKNIFSTVMLLFENVASHDQN